jgi:hypothetical protein
MHLLALCLKRSLRNEHIAYVPVNWDLDLDLVYMPHHNDVLPIEIVPQATHRLSHRLNVPRKLEGFADCPRHLFKKIKRISEVK